MADKYKKTMQDKLEADRAARAKRMRTAKRRQAAMIVFVVLLCLVLILSFCFPTLTYLIE